MKKAAKGGRLSSVKREVTSSDESVTDQPVEKTPKIEESTPSPTAIIRSYCDSSCDLEFEQKLMQAYEKRRAAAEAKYRARNQLDSDREMVDNSKKGPEKKIQNSESTRENDALKLELVELRRREDKAKNVRDAMSRQIHQLNLELAELRSKEEMTKNMENKFTREISVLKEELEAAKTKGKRDVDELSAEIAVLNKALGDSIRKEKDAIDRELNLTLHNSELKEELEKTKKKEDDREIEQNRNINVLKEELDFVKRAEADANHREFELMRVINGLKGELVVEENKREEASKKELDLASEIEVLKAEILGLKSIYQTAEVEKNAMMRRNSALLEELDNAKKQNEEDKIKDTARFLTYPDFEIDLVMSHGLVTEELMEKTTRKRDGGRCKLCDKVFSSNIVKHLMVDHKMKLTHTDIVFSCDECVFKCNRHDELEEHVRSVHSAPVTFIRRSSDRAMSIEL